MSLRVTGLAPGTKHAVHIHETGACTPCSAAGGHFDPGPNSITSPDGNHPYHAGDLINLKVNRTAAEKLIFRDSFDRVAFDNNDGNAKFNGPWREYDVAGAGPSAGVVRIAKGALRLNDRPNTNTQPGITRGADLSKTGMAILSFDYSTSSGVDIGDAVTLEISADDKNFSKEIKIGLQVKGLNPHTKHAVHIHETASCQPCSSARGHFDPGPGSNSNPDGNHPYHSGDLVNLVVDDQGVGSMQTITTRVTLSRGPLSLFDADGSAFIVHVEADSYCPGSAQVGCAGGARAACGIIKVVQQAAEKPTLLLD